MNILDDDNLNNYNQNNDQEKKKKKILSALLICIVLFIAIIALRSVVSPSQGGKKLSLVVNGEQKELKEGLIINIENKSYVKIKELASLIGYEYYNGEYGKSTENKEKGYLSNSDYICGFEKDNKEIYKTEIDSIIDLQKYNVENEIIMDNEFLYIEFNDISLAFNLIVNFDEKENKIVIYTPEAKISELQAKYKENSENSIVIDTKKVANKRAMAYNMLVISNNDKYGVVKLDQNSETIIGNKYSSLEFNESTGNFIVSNSNDKYGIINDKGEGVIDLKYEELSIINYDPILYLVKLNGKYGVLDKDAKTVIDIEYDEIGYKSNGKGNINSLLIVKNMKNNKNGIVVCQKNKYGLVNMSNGEKIFDCELDAIYSKTDKDELKYYIVYNGKEHNLDEYLDYVNSKSVNVE